jgi:hypothetical protein
MAVNLIALKVHEGGVFAFCADFDARRRGEGSEDIRGVALGKLGAVEDRCDPLLRARFRTRK